MQTSNLAPAVSAGHSARLLWCDLVRQIGRETEETVSGVLDELQEGLRSGYVDQQLLTDLRRSLQRAKQIGIATRQIAFIAAGSVRQAPEKVALADVLRGAVAHRAHQARARRLTVDRVFQPVDVLCHRELVATLADSMVSWSLEHAMRRVEIGLQRNGSAARLTCRFEHRTVASKVSRFGGAAAWGATWQLMRHAAEALGWALRCGDEEECTWLALDFSAVPEDLRPALEVTELASDALPSDFRASC